MTTASVAFGVVSAAADITAGNFKTAAEELTLTGISAASGGLGKAGKLIEESRDAETTVLSSGLLGGFAEARARMPKVESFRLRAAKVIMQVPANWFNYLDGSTYGWT
jgi:hypothetical protein